MQVSHQGMKFGTEFLMKSRAVESIRGPSEQEGSRGQSSAPPNILAEMEVKPSYLRGLDLLVLVPLDFQTFLLSSI
jgi:hypothetical protein